MASQSYDKTRPVLPVAAYDVSDSAPVRQCAFMLIVFGDNHFRYTEVLRSAALTSLMPRALRLNVVKSNCISHARGTLKATFSAVSSFDGPHSTAISPWHYHVTCTTAYIPITCQGVLCPMTIGAVKRINLISVSCTPIYHYRQPQCFPHSLKFSLRHVFAHQGDRYVLSVD